MFRCSRQKLFSLNGYRRRSRIKWSYIKFGSTVTGVPYSLTHFLGLWAVGTLIGTTIDVDLITLRRRGIVRILVGMASASSFNKKSDDVDL